MKKSKDELEKLITWATLSIICFLIDQIMVETGIGGFAHLICILSLGGSLLMAAWKLHSFNYYVEEEYPEEE